MTRVAIHGAAGRMGRAMTAGLGEHGIEVVALVDPTGPAQDPRWRASIEDLTPGSVDAVVDFSTPAGVARAAHWCTPHGVALIVGTTGLGDDVRRDLEHAAETIPVIIAPNFAIGAALAERFAVLAAPFFTRAEVVELHHDRKVDAPSGTAVATARAIAAAQRAAGRPTPEEPTQRESVPGSRGADVDGIPVHALRLEGLVAHEEIHFGGPGEGLVIRHDSYDRSSFVAGVSLVLATLPRPAGLVEGLAPFLRGLA